MKKLPDDFQVRTASVSIFNFSFIGSFGLPLCHFVIVLYVFKCLFKGDALRWFALGLEHSNRADAAKHLQRCSS